MKKTVALLIFFTQLCNANEAKNAPPLYQPSLNDSTDEPTPFRTALTKITSSEGNKPGTSTLKWPPISDEIRESAGLEIQN